jgi:hypothetical protein
VKCAVLRRVIMDFRYRTVEATWAAIVVGFVAMLVFAGCRSQERFRPEYLPGDAQLVGGGLVIEWQAPEAGTVYLLERRTGRLVQTFTLAEGEPYHFAVESVVDAEELGDMLGIDIDKAQFLLYFKPAGREGTAP